MQHCTKFRFHNMGLQSFILFTPVHSIPASALFFSSISSITFAIRSDLANSSSLLNVPLLMAVSNSAFSASSRGISTSSASNSLRSLKVSFFFLHLFKTRRFLHSGGHSCLSCSFSLFFPTDPAPLSTRDIACSCPENPLYRHFPETPTDDRPPYP